MIDSNPWLKHWVDRDEDLTVPSRRQAKSLMI